MKKLVFVLLMISTLFIVTGCETEKKETSTNEFKKEYESINNTVNEKNGKKYRSVNIPDNNPMVITTAEEIVKKIEKKESFYVFFAFKECPWCRSVVEQLIKAANEKKVDTIYYVDVKDIRDVKEIDEEGNIKTVSEGTEAYQSLLEQLGEVLEEYTLTKEEEKIEVGEKRIYAPNLVAVYNGKARQLETGISDELEDPYGKLNDKVKKYAYNKFKCLIECLEEESTTCQKNKC